MAELVIKPSNKPVDSSEEIQSLLNTVQDNTVVHFDDKPYWLSKPLKFPNHLKNLNVSLNGAQINKLPAFPKDGACLDIRYAQGLQVNNGKLTGKTLSAPPTGQYAWGDDGLYLASCHDAEINGIEFDSFGDSAWRCATAKDDSVRINSHKIRISECRVTNSHQVSTTSNATASTDFYLNGGTNDYAIEDCTFDLRGSCKIASRSPAMKASIKRCLFKGLDRGVESVGFSGLTIIESEFHGLPNGPISFYNDASRGIPGYPVGHIIFIHNVVKRCGYGRFGNAKWTDGFQAPTHHIGIAFNEFYEPMKPASAPIVFADGPFDFIYAQFNECQGYTGRNIIAAINNATMSNTSTEFNDFT